MTIVQFYLKKFKEYLSLPRSILTMSTKRFFLVWILVSILMFLLSYAWHGYVLNDFSRLSYPKVIFLVLSAFAYMIIGFIVVKVVETKVYEKLFFQKPILKGVIKGAFCGVVFFVIATVVGVSLNTGSGLKNLVLDLTWQMIEQGVGGGVVGLMYVLVENRT